MKPKYIEDTLKDLEEEIEILNKIDNRTRKQNFKLMYLSEKYLKYGYAYSKQKNSKINLLKYNEINLKYISNLKEIYK